MKYFLELDLEGNPVGVWADDQSGSLEGVDYAYSPEREDLAERARALVMDWTEQGLKAIPEDFLEYWSGQSLGGLTVRTEVFLTKDYTSSPECVKGILEKLRRGERL
jgi:hypothetical protein